MSSKHGWDELQLARRLETGVPIGPRSLELQQLRQQITACTARIAGNSSFLPCSWALAMSATGPVVAPALQQRTSWATITALGSLHCHLPCSWPHLQLQDLLLLLHRQLGICSRSKALSSPHTGSKPLCTQICSLHLQSARLLTAAQKGLLARMHSGMPTLPLPAAAG